jgi:hypothetical protein
MVLDRLDHHVVLEARVSHLHPSARANRRVRDVTVTADLVAGVHDHNAAIYFVGQDTSDFPQFGRFSDSRSAQDEDRLATANDVVDNVDGAFESATDTAGQPDDFAVAVSNRRDTVQSPFDSSSVILAEFTNFSHNELDIVFRNHGLGPTFDTSQEATFCWPTVIHDNLNEALQVGVNFEFLPDDGREHIKQLS